jgi:cold shock CspA family protein
VYVAIRDSFEAVQRRLEDYVRRRRGLTKTHEPLLHGRVVRVFDDGHGFIEDGDGNSYCFDDAAVRSGDRLDVGAEVEFIDEAAAQGLQAKRVTAARGAAG